MSEVSRQVFNESFMNHDFSFLKCESVSEAAAWLLQKGLSVQQARNPARFYKERQAMLQIAYDLYVQTKQEMRNDV